ncbi:hypothetical protein H4Q26_002211 [Puccinia striiformis f. sp. tritici PST-130]|nr:hypothetical protein H4Q26_002211 [Puccinia striiformis f. sp. tritici PST-130]
MTVPGAWPQDVTDDPDTSLVGDGDDFPLTHSWGLAALKSSRCVLTQFVGVPPGGNICPQEPLGSAEGEDFEPMPT